VWCQMVVVSVHQTIARDSARTQHVQCTPSNDDYQLEGDKTEFRLLKKCF
jgi:hypothetical protein